MPKQSPAPKIISDTPLSRYPDEYKCGAVHPAREKAQVVRCETLCLIQLCKIIKPAFLTGQHLSQIYHYLIFHSKQKTSTLSLPLAKSPKTWGQRSASFRSGPQCMESQLERSHFLPLSTCIENLQVRAWRGGERMQRWRGIMCRGKGCNQ